MVRDYSDYEILSRFAELSSFTRIPEDYWIVGIQSKEDTYNEFDDIFHIFKGIEFVTSITGTTNAGTTGLKHYSKYNSKGVAVIKTDEIYYGLWKYGLHRGRMPALRQTKPIKYFRDWNKNILVEEIGKLYEGIIGINFHTVLYQRNLSFWRRFIGGWSTGCQVANHVGEYYEVLEYFKKQKEVTYCLLKEWED
jgi:hypothetical protein